MRPRYRNSPANPWTRQERAFFAGAILLTLVWVGLVIAGASWVVDMLSTAE